MTLVVEGLSVHYGRVLAVRSVDLEVRRGEATALVGANGAGKTTTLHAIAGTRRIVSGDVRFEGESVAGLAPEEIVRRGITLVPENRRIFVSLTVAENLRLGTGIQSGGRSSPNDDANMLRVLRLFPILEKYWGAPAGNLSGGEQQQLAIGRALVMQPKLLMLDEPSLGLAPRLVDMVFEALAELRGNGQTILLVEQNVQRALRFADHSYVMRSGRIELEKTREQLESATRSEVEAAFFGSDGPQSSGASVVGEER